jgi:predicted GIY-YIG superfamily endonuclease
MAYKCWIYVLKVLPTNSYYVGFTSNLEERLDAHRKGRGHKATRFGPLELVEVVECESDSVYELEKAKTLEYIEKYGKDKIVGYRFSFKKRKKQEDRAEHPPPPATYSLIRYGEDDEEYFRVCRECMHFDYSDHKCTLLDETTLGPYTCVFWSTGLWGESWDEIADNATRQTAPWFTPERADLVRTYFERGCRIYQIFEVVFPELAVKKPYTAFRTQKDLVYDFIYRSVGIPKGEDEWDEYEKRHEKIRERVGSNRCTEED